jgi:hypothetical protein
MYFTHRPVPDLTPRPSQLTVTCPFDARRGRGEIFPSSELPCPCQERSLVADAGLIHSACLWELNYRAEREKKRVETSSGVLSVS